MKVVVIKVVVLGGYGVFGSRLAELLIRDGHEVWLAGRDIDKAAALAARIEEPHRIGLRKPTGAVRATDSATFNHSGPHGEGAATAAGTVSPRDIRWRPRREVRLRSAGVCGQWWISSVLMVT